jgi:AcrR family transcriptional regulator
VRKDIQLNALRLFREQGYEETTVQQIAEAAVISESTFYRYFPTKADVVLSDELDPQFVAAFRAQPPELTALEAMRNAFRSVIDTFSTEDKARQRELLQLSLSVPELRAATLDQFAGGIDLLLCELANRTGRQADDPAIRALAGAIIGAGVVVMFAVASDPTADIAVLMDETMGSLSAGLAL